MRLQQLELSMSLPSRCPISLLLQKKSDSSGGGWCVAQGCQEAWQRQGHVQAVHTSVRQLGMRTVSYGIHLGFW